MNQRNDAPRGTHEFNDHASGPDEFLGYGYVFHDAGPGEHEMYFFSSRGEYILRYAVNY